jgi:hypothetical protein
MMFRLGSGDRSLRSFGKSSESTPIRAKGLFPFACSEEVIALLPHRVCLLQTCLLD